MNLLRMERDGLLRMDMRWIYEERNEIHEQKRPDRKEERTGA